MKRLIFLIVIPCRGCEGEDRRHPLLFTAALQPVPVKQFLACKHAAGSRGEPDQSWDAPNAPGRWQRKRVSRRDPAVLESFSVAGLCVLSLLHGLLCLRQRLTSPFFTPFLFAFFIFLMPAKCLSDTLFKSGGNEVFAIYISPGSLKVGYISAVCMVCLTALLKTLGRPRPDMHRSGFPSSDGRAGRGKSCKQPCGGTSSHLEVGFSLARVKQQWPRK